MAEEEKKSIADLEQESNELKKRVTLLRTQNELEASNYEIREKYIKLNEKLEETEEARIEMLTEMMIKSDDINKILSDMELTAENIDDNWGLMVEEIEKKKDMLGEVDKTLIENYKNAKKRLEIAKEQKEILIEQQESITNQKEGANHILTTLTGVSDQWKKSSLGSQYHAIQMGLAEEAVDNWKEAIQEKFTVDNIMLSTLEKVQESTLAVAWAQDNAASSLAKSTQTGDQYTSQMSAVHMQNLRMSITADQASEAISQLHNQMDGFSEMSEEAQVSLASNVAMMDQMGVSSSVMAGFMQDTNKVLNMSNQEAQNLSRRFMAVQSSGKPLAEIFQDYNTALPQLAQHGEQTNEVFLGLVAASDKLGLSMDKLIGIASQFNTFEGAADAAGKLNAVLGGDYLNSVELLAATEEERIGMLIRSMELSGKQWQSMGRFEKMAVANAAGIDDMATAQKMFNQSYSEYQSSVNEAQTTMGLSNEQMEEAAEKSASFQDKLQSIAQIFAARLLPALETLDEWLITPLISANDALRKLTGNAFGFGEALLIVVGVVMLAKTWITILTGVQAGLATMNMLSALTSNTDADAKNRQSKSMNRVSSSAKGFGKAMLGAAAAVLAMGAGIGLAAWGLGSLAKNMENLSQEQLDTFITALGVLVIGLLGFAAVLLLTAKGAAIAAVPLLAVGGALFLMGAAIAVAAAGLSLLVDKLSQLTEGQIMGLIKLFGTMASLGAIAPVLGAAAIGISSIAGSLALLGLSINSLDLSKLSELKGLMQSVERMDQKKAVTVGAMWNQIGEASMKIKEGGNSGGIKEVRKIIEKVVNSTGGGEAGSSGDKKFTFNFKLDTRTLKDFIVEVVNEEVKIRGNE